MYLKIMHSDDYKMHGENDFSLVQIHKGQRIACWQSPGKGMEIQLIENDGVVETYKLYGPAYVMNDAGKTIATYGGSLAAMGNRGSASQTKDPAVVDTGSGQQ